MNYEETTKKLQEKFNACKGKIRNVPAYLKDKSGTVVDFFKEKRTKLYIAICFFIQAIAFLVVFFSVWDKKKKLAGVFGALAVAGATVGTLFLISSLDVDERGKKKLIHIGPCYENEDDCDDITVEFTDDEEMVDGEEDN